LDIKETQLAKYLKYVISLFLALVVMANDCTLDSQAKSQEYYQSSYIILKRELDFKNLRFYKFNPSKAVEKISFLIHLNFLNFKQICSFQTRIVLRLCTLLYKNINSFIKQSVYVNEIITSNHFNKSLYSA